MQAILKKLHAVMSELDYIQKDKKSQQGYSYVSEYAIKSAIQPLFVKHGVVVSFDVTTCSVVGEVATKSGGAMTIVQCKIRYRFFDIATAECLDGEWVGEGMDSGDKGLGKAITVGIRSLLSGMFLIPTGNDPEEDAASDQPREARTQPKSQPVTSAPQQNGEWQCPAHNKTLYETVLLPLFTRAGGDQTRKRNLLNKGFKEWGVNSLEQACKLPTDQFKAGLDRVEAILQEEAGQ